MPPPIERATIGGKPQFGPHAAQTHCPWSERSGRPWRSPCRHVISRSGGIAAAILLGIALAACGNAKANVSNSGNVDGVTANSITVGGMAAVTGPLPGIFSPIFDGVRAYLDMVNAAGGISGRKIDFPTNDALDDGADPSQDVQQAHTLVQSDHVFAVVGVGTPSFAGASFLALNDVPTFGYNVNPDWSDRPSLFGSQGSFIDFENPGSEPAYLAEKVGAKRVGIISYNVTQSKEGCIGVANDLTKFGIKLSFEDYSVAPPAIDLSADVTRMRNAGVDFVASCLDLNGNLVLARALQSAGMGNVTQYWLDGYDEGALKASGSLMNGVYLLLGHVPFESGQGDPVKYPAMATYLRELHKYFPADQPGEASLAGWESAEMFCSGLKMIGHNVTRARLVAAINSLSSYTDGIVAPIDWRLEHKQPGLIDCNAFVQVRNGRFVPVFGSGGSVFTCLLYPQPASHKVVVVNPPGDIPGG
jgi:branched-chain amino acid transport system substrate-binding protein